MAVISMTMTTTSAAKNRSCQSPTEDEFLKTLSVKGSKYVDVNSATKNNVKLQIEASLKEKVVAVVTSAALPMAMVVPESALATDRFSTSLKNFLLNIGTGGFVVFAIIGAVIGVSNFDPVKRT
ncbi:hypothetical protein F511_14136 [Dorcoceras hygrometricum]|uniref:Photosystem II reaction center X protein n=1 Tax=Dorcoceras hygrometricum TaxID=472368 RepID=A0A2Z7CW90_9LAMI|nr:hypothetical protein F511_14136 [Dorcoceras hygrometricum]